MTEAAKNWSDGLLESIREIVRQEIAVLKDQLND
jgi:hypothetical protein